jgi:hypothetical protein
MSSISSIEHDLSGNARHQTRAGDCVRSRCLSDSRDCHNECYHCPCLEPHGASSSFRTRCKGSDYENPKLIRSSFQCDKYLTNGDNVPERNLKRVANDPKPLAIIDRDVHSVRVAISSMPLFAHEIMASSKRKLHRESNKPVGPKSAQTVESNRLVA